jgi:copper transport protein
VGDVARRAPVYLIALLFSAALGVLITAAPASAHAVLVSSSPADGSVVARAPARVSATFDEPVGVSADSLRVFAPNGARADSGPTVHGSKPTQIVVPLKRGLGPGTYTVSWHVISADSHPVSGALTFSIGAPSSTAVKPASLSTPPSQVVGVLFGVVRWLDFYCFALLSGTVTFVIWCWPAGATRPSVLRLTMGAWGGLATSVLAAVLLQGVYGAGQGMSHLFWPNVLHATLYSRYGRALAVRLLLVVAALFAFTTTLAGLPGKGPRQRAVTGTAWGLLTAALAATWSVADHAGTGIQVGLAVPADIIHLSAMATWLGGLAMLVTVVLRRHQPSGRDPARTTASRRSQAATVDAAQAVIRFSPIALGCVLAILATGTYLAWRGVGTLGALTGTAYGRLLLVKIAGLCVLIGLGYLARRRIAGGLHAPVTALRTAAPMTAAVPARVKAGVAASPAARASGTSSTPAVRGGVAKGRRRGEGGNGHSRAGAPVTAEGGENAGNGVPDVARMVVTLRRLRWSVAAETVIAITVLAVTAVLVNTPTGRESYFPPAVAKVAFDTGAAGGRGTIAVTVTPARLGPNRLRISVTGTNGRPYRPAQLEVALLLPARHLGPLPVHLTRAGPGEYLGGPAVISSSGNWQLQFTVRSDAFDEVSLVTHLSIH